MISSGAGGEPSRLNSAPIHADRALGGAAGLFPKGKQNHMIWLNILQIVISIILVAIVLMQVRGQGTGLFGAAEGSFRTRRGLEKALFQFTIVMVVVFIMVSILSVRFA